MATYNGVSLGYIETCNPMPLPNERQINKYPGVNGLQVIDLGQAGGVTTITGAILDPDRSVVVAAFLYFQSLQLSGQPYTLVDAEGNTWLDVILVRFQPVDQMKQLAGGQGWTKKYEAEFLHLSM